MHRSTPTTTPIDVDGSQQLHRDGAEGARRAHNPEVVGSNPTSGIYHSLALQKLQRCHHSTLTPLAQRQSTLAHNSGVTRSKLVGGIYHSLALQKLAVKLDVKGSETLAGVAQRKSA